MVSEEKVWQALGTVMDPEIPFSVVDLGLVYGVETAEPGRVRVQLTLTTRGCPLVRRISDDAREAIQRLTGATDVQVEIVWDPPWNPGMASPEVQKRLGWN
ncbi:MAG: metal-sulfur cluster assembly factor [Acidobacteria bacterium]|jgi:metal-sulfur cluster biosynthetic enzyme|nr:metal-sulfur cluster assembly factor [Acidobacteriota bacterium]